MLGCPLANGIISGCDRKIHGRADIEHCHGVILLLVTILQELSRQLVSLLVKVAQIGGYSFL